MLATKKKLMMAVVMLTISGLMLTSASFAWFTISTNPEVSNLTTKVVVNQNLEIALADTATTEPLAAATGDTGNQYKWGNIIDLSATGAAKTAYDAFVTAGNTTLRPATLGSTSKKFQYPNYGTDGRVSTLADLTVGTRTSGFGNITDGATTPKIYAYYVDFWIRSNVAGTVTLSTAAKRSTNGILGGGTVFTSTNQVLADNVSIAFEDITTAASANGAATAATAGTPVASTGTTPTYSTAFTDDSVVVLTANTAKLIRMYVYLEGAAVTNASASTISGTPITGTLNVQFATTGVTKSMDAET
jgi:hypothetical protein